MPLRAIDFHVHLPTPDWLDGSMAGYVEAAEAYFRSPVQRQSLEELAAQAAAGTLEQSLPHPRTLLPELPATTADLWIAGRLRNGNAVNLPEFSTAPLAKVFAGQRDLVAIVRRVAGTLFQPIVVLG